MRNIMSLLIFHHRGYNNGTEENENEVGICTTNKRIFLRRSISRNGFSELGGVDYPGNASALSHFFLCLRIFFSFHCVC